MPIAKPDNPVPLRAVIFDLDDTLIDTLGLLVADGHLRAAAAMAAAIDPADPGVAGGSVDVADRDARGWTDVRRTLTRDDLTPAAQRIYDLRRERFDADPSGDLEAAVLDALEVTDSDRREAAAEAGRRAYHRPRVPHEGLALQGAHSMLRRLRRDFTLYLVTIGDPEIQGEKARKSKLLPSFDQVRLVPRTATKAGALADLIATAGLQPVDCCAVGDRPRGEIAAANGLGMYTIRVRRGEFAAVEPQAPDEHAHWTVEDIRDVQGILTEHFLPAPRVVEGSPGGPAGLGDPGATASGS